MANYALRLPESLFAYARQVAEEERVSVNYSRLKAGACEATRKPG